jgi:hypothetical protein
MEPAVVQQEEAGIKGLREGFGDRVESIDIAYPQLISEAYASPQSLIPDTSVTTPLSFLMAPDALQRLRKEFPDRNLWISQIGLPVGILTQDVWQSTSEPRFALLLPDLRVIGDAEEIRRAMLSGKLVAFVLTRQGQLFDTQTMGTDLAAEFAKRYVLVTAENVDAVLADFPELFQSY